MSERKIAHHAAPLYTGRSGRLRNKKARLQSEFDIGTSSELDFGHLELAGSGDWFDGSGGAGERVE
jgi:hypothetical protein